MQIAPFIVESTSRRPCIYSRSSVQCNVMVIAFWMQIYRSDAAKQFDQVVLWILALIDKNEIVFNRIVRYYGIFTQIILWV